MNKENSKALADMVGKRTEMEHEIRMLQTKKLSIEYGVSRLLVQEHVFDCLKVNWTRVQGYIREGA